MRHLVFGLGMALLLSASVVAASGSGSLAFITDFANSSLLQVDTVTGKPVAIPVGSSPFGVAVLPDGSKVYVTNSSFRNGSVSVVKVGETTSKLVTVPLTTPPLLPFRMPFGVAAAADGKRVFVTNYTGGSMSVIDTATDTVVRTVSPVGFLPRGVVANPVGPYVYIANQATDDVAFVNTTNDSFSVVRMHAGASPYGVAIDPLGQFLYVALQGDGKLIVMNASAGTILGSIQLESGLAGVAVSPDGKRVYVTNTSSGTVSVVDVDSVARTWTLNRRVTVGSMPVGVSVSSDSSRVYVANSNGASLSVINTGNFVVTPLSLPGAGPVAFGNSLLPGPNAITVRIDVVPKEINLKAPGSIPVVIFGSDPKGANPFEVSALSFDDLLTIHFHGWPVKVKGNGEPMVSYGDFDNDGWLDVMVHIDRAGPQAAGAAASDCPAMLSGVIGSPNGRPFEGCDTSVVFH